MADFLTCSFITCFKSLNVVALDLLPEAYGDVQEWTQPGAVVTRFLSLQEKEFKSETDVGKHQKFIERQVHT